MPEPKFIPKSTEDLFALFLSRELQDSSRARFYAGLARTYSLSLLLNALRSARKASGGAPTPTHFLAALRGELNEEVIP